MAEVQAVVEAAEELRGKDEAALELLLGMREKEIEKDPNLKNDPNLTPVYGPHMGLIDDLKSLGGRLALRWSKELYQMVCGAENGVQADRKKILDALNLGEAAVIGAVAATLLAIAVPAALAAAAAPLIVKRFIWPARDELCVAWGEAING